MARTATQNRGRTTDDRLARGWHGAGEMNAGSLALLTDLYQLTMCQGYWANELTDRETVFHLTFRKAPFRGGFTVACGLHSAIEYLRGLKFSAEDIAYLGSLTGTDGKALFAGDFLDYLRELRFTCDLDAVPEGTVVFPHEPLVRVQGPVIPAQLVETALLNIINFQTLIATKAARICLAARGDAVIEFGLRRAQGMDGGLSASRAAYIGGCAGTSNVLAGKTYGIPVKGTHAHSWVMVFENEVEAFEAYARTMPNNCIFLVDTYNTLEGVRRAAAVGRKLRQRGHHLVGIRLDSGDLAYLSVEARKILDEAGLKDAAILASNDLDERTIASLKEQGAAINMWGVGTRLVTAHDDPALGGVYKLSAIRKPHGPWEYKVKLSEQTEKVTTPGILQVRRFSVGKEFVGDAIYDSARKLPSPVTIVHPVDMTRRKHVPADAQWEDLLVPVFRAGELVYGSPELASMRERVQRQLAGFHPGIKRFINPHQYPAGLEASLHDLKTRLILGEREGSL